MKILPILMQDFYKAGHIFQYPKNTTMVYSNFTARGSRIPNVNEVVVFGTQYLIKEFLIKQFNNEFFLRTKEVVIAEYKRRMDNALGPNAINTSHLEALHDLGYLPLEIKAIPEGTVVPTKIPVLTIKNTHKDFSWLPNFLETLISNTLWHPMTSATIAHQYNKILNKYANKTSDMTDFVQWQAHDFSMRGQTSLESSVVSGAAHLLSFTGTDTIPAIDFMEQYYNADCTKELIGGSVPATEHAVMCLGGKETEAQTFERLITEVYPTGIVSIVSDTWDYWNTLTVTVGDLKDKIMTRDGKVVIRPDSGDPVKIICGDPSAKTPEERLGSISLLWIKFGGTVNSKGYKQLDPHIGLIYGDSITLERAEEICKQLEAKGFASTNVVFGVGSYTYQHVTRDTLGFAMKATYGVVNEVPVEIYKDPKTDNGVKKSAKGLLMVDNNFVLHESVSEAEEKTGILKTVFLDGKLVVDEKLSDIRARLAGK